MAGKASRIWQGRKLLLWPVPVRPWSGRCDGLVPGWDGKMHEEEEGRVCTDGFEQIAPCTVSPQKAGKTLKHTNATTSHSSTNHHEPQSLRREFNSLSNHNYTSVSRRLKALHGITIIIIVIIITYWLILNDPLTYEFMFEATQNFMSDIWGGKSQQPKKIMSQNFPDHLDKPAWIGSLIGSLIRTLSPTATFTKNIRKETCLLWLNW